MTSVIEGDGVFKDYNGSEDGAPVFETRDKDEWEQYCKKNGITRSGSGKCIVCNTIFEFENFLSFENIYSKKAFLLLMH